MSNHDPLTLKLSLREKCAYGVGDFGSNLMLCIGTLYLLKFIPMNSGCLHITVELSSGGEILHRFYRYAHRRIAGFTP